jgi:hypothetical protein
MTPIASTMICTWPQRGRRLRKRNWRKPQGSVIVSRPSLWGNQYKVENGNQQAAVDAYRFWLASHPERVAQAREQLAGKQLLCYCRLDQPCHADVLIEVANTPESAYGIPVPVADMSAWTLMQALVLGARIDGAERAVKLLATWPEEYLLPAPVRGLIGAVTAPALPVARVDWDGLASLMKLGKFDVPDHIAAVWAYAAYLTTEMPIAIERALSDMDVFACLKAQELTWEGTTK